MRAFSLCVMVLVAIGLCCASPRGRIGGDANAHGHWVHGEQLKSLMNELDQASRAAWPQELEGEPGRPTAGMSETLATAARHAELLADTAREIPQSVDLEHLSLAERQAFLSIAQTLGQQAGELAESARAGDLSGMHRVRDELAATCNACHQRFRDVSGPL